MRAFLVALGMTTFTIVGASSLNTMTDHKPPKELTKVALTTKKVDPPKVKKRVRKKQKKLKNIKQAPPISPNMISAITGIELELPTTKADNMLEQEWQDEIVEPPVPSPSNPIPHYPLEARQEGIQGKVVIRVLVDEYGYTTQHRVIQSHESFDTEVLKVIGQWRFTPAKRGGQALEKWVDIPFNFVL